MKYEVVITRSAKKQLAEIPTAHRERISRRIDGLEANPRPDGVRKMAGVDEYYRIRVGEYRVIYLVEDNTLLVLVVRVASRKDAYRSFR